MHSFRILASVDEPRPFVHATIASIDSRTGHIRDRLGLIARPLKRGHGVGTPWISLLSSPWKTDAPGDDPRQLRAALGDELVVWVNLGAGQTQTLRTTVGPPAAFDPVLHVTVALRIIASSPLSAMNRATMAKAVAHQIDQSNEVMGQCGILLTLDDRGSLFATPPPGALFTLGEELGLVPQTLEVNVTAANRQLQSWRNTKTLEPRIAAQDLAEFLSLQELKCKTMTNPRRLNQAYASADMHCELPDGHSAGFSLSSNANNAVITSTSVNLSDGLECYKPDAAAVGSLEQRALVHGLGFLQPQTVKVLVVERLSCAHQLGQSVADDPQAPLFGTVFVDLRGLSRGRETFTLAHELGHVLLGSSAHPEDSGETQKTLLMNATASSIYLGPSQLTEAQCLALRRSPWAKPAQR